MGEKKKKGRRSAYFSCVCGEGKGRETGGWAGKGRRRKDGWEWWERGQRKLTRVRKGAKRGWKERKGDGKRIDGEGEKEDRGRGREGERFKELREGRDRQ